VDSVPHHLGLVERVSGLLQDPLQPSPVHSPDARVQALQVRRSSARR